MIDGFKDIFNNRFEELIMENPESIKIPQALCEEILGCEIQIQIGNVNQVLVVRTIELYMEVMSFFMFKIEERQDCPANSICLKGHQYYQQKIKKLLMRRDVQKCLNGERTNPKAIHFELEIKKINETADQQTKTLLSHFKKYQENHNQLIQKTVTEQNIKLQQRIDRRLRSKSNCILTQNSSFFLNVIK